MPYTSYIGSLTVVLKGDCRNMQVSLFRFENYLALSPGFLASVHFIWRHPVVGTPMYSVTRKLKTLKPVFRQQRHCKGDLAMNVKLAAGFLEVAQNILQFDRHNSLLLLLEHCCRLVYLKASKLEQARHILTDDEAQAIIRPVTIDEVKTAFFDIEEDKAPGPDGFSSGFFKAAWPVVGGEVSNAIIDFFKTGRLLKQLNATLLTLIHKKIDSRIKGWEGVQLSFAGRVQLIKSVLISFKVYWAMAFILPKGIIKEMIKRLRTFLWKGTSASGYPKVAWEAVCRPIEEGGLGIKDILALNRALMSKHLWAVIKQDRTSIWVDWIIQVQLRNCSIWTVKENKGAWGWRKMLSLRHSLMSHIHYRVGNGDSVSLWHDPWHPLGPLISRIPRGPQLTSTGLLDKLSVVIKDGQWNWPLITDLACLEVTHMLPPILEGPDRISWKSKDGSFNTSIAYELIHPPGPKGLAFCARMESLRHMITFSFHALFPAVALPLSDSRSHFRGPTGIGNMVFNGRHPDGVESMWLTQHIDLYWHQLSTTSSRNAMQSASSSVVDHPRLGRLVVEEIRQTIISVHLRHYVGSLGLYRLWKIPWPVEGFSI
ncbi:UNVERIFIED_CONTAM: hypothetical protein Sangu_2591300 [Sesamum angustifolium]|uniref:Uncharacterized protein n=1 Tax=Sesamum angustifolium TaxID=2727405 RepID=A0AAW2J8Z7_9LAMI